MEDSIIIIDNEHRLSNPIQSEPIGPNGAHKKIQILETSFVNEDKVVIGFYGTDNTSKKIAYFREFNNIYTVENLAASIIGDFNLYVPDVTGTLSIGLTNNKFSFTFTNFDITNIHAYNVTAYGRMAAILGFKEITLSDLTEIVEGTTVGYTAPYEVNKTVTYIKSTLNDNKIYNPNGSVDNYFITIPYKANAAEYPDAVECKDFNSILRFSTNIPDYCYQPEIHIRIRTLTAANRELH